MGTRDNTVTLTRKDQCMHCGLSKSDWKAAIDTIKEAKVMIEELESLVLQCRDTINTLSGKNIFQRDQ